MFDHKSALPTVEGVLNCQLFSTTIVVLLYVKRCKVEEEVGIITLFLYREDVTIYVVWNYRKEGASPIERFYSSILLSAAYLGPYILRYRTHAGLELSRHSYEEPSPLGPCVRHNQASLAPQKSPLNNYTHQGMCFRSSTVVTGLQIPSPPCLPASASSSRNSLLMSSESTHKKAGSNSSRSARSNGSKR